MTAKDTILAFSLALQKREKTLTDLSRKTEVIPNSASSLLSSLHIGTLRQFFNAKIEEQRKMMNEQSSQLMTALIEAVLVLDDRNSLMVILPAIDGCLFGMPWPF